MGGNLFNLKDIKTVEIPDIFVAQWFHTYYHADFMIDDLLLEVFSVMNGSDEYVDIFGQNNKTSFGYFLRQSVFSKRKELDKQEITHLFEISEVRRAYFQYLLRLNFESLMADGVPAPLYQLFHRKIDQLFPCLFVCSPQEELFNPICQIIRSDDSIEHRDGRIDTVDLYKFLEKNVKSCTNIHWLKTILSLFKDDLFYYSEQERMTFVELPDPNSLRHYDSLSFIDRFFSFGQNEEDHYCFPAYFTSRINWLTDLLKKTSLSPEEIYLLLEDEFGFDYCRYGIVESYNDGTRAPFPKLCALAAAECEGKPEYTEICEDHWDDPLLCALLASVTDYKEYPKEIQKEFFRMCHYAGLKIDTSLYDFSQDCNYTTKKYLDNPFIKIDPVSCLKTIVVDAKPQLEYRVYTRTDTSDGDMMTYDGNMTAYMMEEGVFEVDSVIDPNFDETYDTLQEALSRAIELE